MRHCHWLKFLVVAMYSTLAAPPERAESADYGIELTFHQRLTTSGQKRYSVRASFQRDEVANKIVAPNRHVFDYRNQYAESLTFQQFQTLAFGEWSAQSASSIVDFQVPALTQDECCFQSAADHFTCTRL